MKLFIIQLHEPLERGVDWRLVRANDEDDARRLAAEDAKEFDEDPSPWLSDECSSVHELKSTGEPGLVWRTNSGEW